MPRHMQSNLSTTANKPLSLAIFATLVVLLQSGCSLLGIRTSEEATYQTLQQQGQFEIRQYEPRVIATTRVDSDFDDAGSQAFRRLFNYISGDNIAQREIAMTVPVIASEAEPTGSREIPMTTPVTGQKDGLGWRYSFVLPSTFTLQNAPEPTDDRVRIEPIPARKVAVFRYSGSWGIEQFDDHSARLLQWLEQQKLEPESAPRIAAYDPPFALPFLRRNEIMIDIKP